MKNHYKENRDLLLQNQINSVHFVGHITTPVSYKQYCKSRGLDPTLATKITN